MVQGSLRRQFYLSSPFTRDCTKKVKGFCSVMTEDRSSRTSHVTDVMNDLAIQQNFTSSYSPQSSGAAEVNVRILKQVIRQLLESKFHGGHALWNTQHKFYNAEHCRKLGLVRHSASTSRLEG
eukprot:4085083-Amphidinium_carterae.1